MALKSSFDSKVNRNFRVNSIMLEIKKSHLINTVYSEGKDVIFISDSDTNVDPIQHPLYDADDDVVYLDMRGYSTIDRSGSFTAKQDMDTELQLLRAKLELCWMRATSNELFSAFSYSNEIFVRWFTSHLVSLKNLTPAQDTRLRALVALYSIGLYYNNITEPALITRYYRLISQTYYIPIEDVEAVANSISQPFPRDLSEFIECMHEADISARLNDVNEVTIQNTLSRAWFFTANPGPVIGLAVEYPPAFCALVTMATKYRLFKKTGIGMVVENNSRRDAHKNHIGAINILINQKVGEPHPGKYKGGYGMEQYPINAVAIPDFHQSDVGAESEMLSRILVGIAAGSVAGLLTYGIIKFIEWVTGNGGGGSAKSIQNIQTETQDLIKRSNSSIAQAHSQQMKIGQQMSKDRDEMFDAILANKGRSDDHMKGLETIKNHFKNDAAIAAIAIYCVHASNAKNNHAEIAERLITIDKKTSMFKDSQYTMIGLLVSGKMSFSMIAAVKLLTDDPSEIISTFEAINAQYEDILEKITTAVDVLKGEVTEEVLNSLTGDFKQAAGELDGIGEQAAIMNRRLLPDEATIDILNDMDAIRELKAIDGNKSLPPAVFEHYERLVANIGKRKSAVASIANAAKSISDDENHVVNRAAKEISVAVGRALHMMATITRPFRAAIRFSEIYVNVYLNETKHINAEVDKYLASLKKISS